MNLHKIIRDIIKEQKEENSLYSNKLNKVIDSLKTKKKVFYQKINYFNKFIKIFSNITTFF